MPKIDPRTGCQVMTTQEFWAAEAQQAGMTDGSALHAEFMTEMAEDLRREEAHLRANALSTLRDAVKEWNEGDPEMLPTPMPDAVLEVLKATIKDSFRSSGYTLSAVVKAGDVTGVLSATVSSFGGSWSEPPDYDINVEWASSPK